jgi:hypothetical protein
MYAILQGVSSRKIGREIFILNRNDNSVYCLNPTAACIWRGIGERRSVEEVVSELTGRFDVDGERARRDFSELTARLKEKKLIEEQ